MIQKETDTTGKNKKSESPFLSPFKKNPIGDIERNALRYLLWSVLQKFIVRNSKNSGKKESQLTPDLCNDVRDFCSELASSYEAYKSGSDLKNQTEFSKVHILRTIKSLTTKHYYTIKAGAYNDLRNSIYRFPAYTTGKVQIAIARIQLEALCIYAFEKSYDEFKKDNHRLYIGNETIQFIKSNLSSHFGEFICKMLSAIENFNHGNSSNLINIVLESLSEETDTIIDALSESKLVRPADKYLHMLFRFMDKASAGFGVNIREFNKIWKDDIGKKILAINQEQIKGRKTSDGNTIPAFPYRRIFLMDAENATSILTSVTHKSRAELETIKIQLQYDVLVFCVFQDDWKATAGSNHHLFDYAILKVDGCPMLMGTKFDKTNKDEIEKGVFYTDTTKAISHFSATLGKLLANDNIKVYKPSLNSKNGKIEFSNPLAKWEKLELINHLKKAAEC